MTSEQDRLAEEKAEIVKTAGSSRERSAARLWLRQNGYRHLVEPSDPRVPVCGVHDHLDRKCACYDAKGKRIRP